MEVILLIRLDATLTVVNDLSANLQHSGDEISALKRSRKVQKLGRNLD